MIRLAVSSKAEADLIAAFDWYQAKAPGLGVDFVSCVDITIAVIGQSPGIFRKRVGDHRMAMLPRFPYAVYFIHNDETAHISIRRILHFSENALSKL